MCQFILKAPPKRSQHMTTQHIATLGAVTHSTVNGISRGKFYRGTSHVDFSIP